MGEGLAVAGKQPNRATSFATTTTPHTVTKAHVCVSGTWAWRDQDKPTAWFNSTSPFAQQLAVAGYAPLRTWPFLWTTKLNGTDGWRRWFARFIPRAWERGDHVDWIAGGEALYSYCEAAKWPDLVIAHSHAGQVVAYACARRGLQIPLLITVSTPVRSDLLLEYAATRERVGRWIHLFDPDADPIAWAGGFGDGHVSASRIMPQAENYPLTGAGHSGALNDPRIAQAWIAEGWL